MENNQYFSKNNNELPSNPKFIEALINGLKFKFKTDVGVFSRDFLDYATKLLLEKVDFCTLKKGKILDIGCGYGPVGIYVAKTTKNEVVMLDINPRALELTKENLLINNVSATVLESDCLNAVLNQKFEMAILNPPIHAGKEVVYKMFEQSFQVLENGGSLWIVIQQKHGAPSAIKKLETIFKNVIITYKKKGFYIIKCVK